MMSMERRVRMTAASFRFLVGIGVFVAFGFAAQAAYAAPNTPSVQVKAEENVYSYIPPDNGSGPLWSYGCTPIARLGDTVVISEQETGNGVPPMCNTRWRLLRRENGAWKVWSEEQGYHQREPCPVAVLPPNSLYLYVNDSQAPQGSSALPCKPYLLRYMGPPWKSKGVELDPKWDGPATFTYHSYRGYSADPAYQQLVMFNIDAMTSIQHWCWLTADGKTLANGKLTYPIRACYSQVQLSKGACYVLAVSDIVEPVKAWREYKFAQTKRHWDYVFRILYYTWTPDLKSKPFAPPMEIANVDKTAGYINNQDLWVAPDGTAYILYSESEVQNALLRDKFFPGKSILPSMKLAVVKDGKVVSRKTLVEGTADCVATWGRFQLTPEGELYALIYYGGKDRHDALVRIRPESTAAPIRVPFKEPFTSFCLANVREGNAPSRTIDVVGYRGRGDTISYGQIAIK